MFVTAPVNELGPGALTSDQTGAHDDAARRLDEVLGALSGSRPRSSGARSAPRTRFRQLTTGSAASRRTRSCPSRIGERQTNWLEAGVVELAGPRYDQPIEHIAVP